MAQRGELNVKGLSPTEAQAAIDRAKEFKIYGIARMEEERVRIVEEIGHLLAKLDGRYASEMLKTIKEYHPELLKDL